MRAAVVHQPGDTPVLEQFTDPQPGPGVSVGALVAATLNPLDVAFVNDQFPLRRLQPPCIAGYEAVVQLADGTRWYVTAPPSPYGTLAELVPVPDSDAFPVPAGLDPALAAALGVAGTAGWLALDYRAHLQPGETVLVLGAGGSAGRLAVQSARALGASLVVGAARRKDSSQAADLGADAVVDLADEQATDAGLAAAAPGGYDVIVDFLWGGVAPHAMNHAKRGARYVQVGNAAGATSTITGLVLRNKLLTLVGHSLFATPPSCAGPPTRDSQATRSTASSPWIWSRPGWKTSSGPGSTSRPVHHANSWSRPDQLEDVAVRCVHPLAHARLSSRTGITRIPAVWRAYSAKPG